ncbi:MAG: pantoate--beta-alanine ligase [Actinomycetota bacterium]|nr:pantoate--beta-alanine ligase [Actinomycetota bacterium]
MDVVRHSEDMRRWRRGAYSSPFALFPTMGALHDGHLSLVRQARDSALLAVSIFVNPLQFGPAEDLAAYPRDLDRDLGLLEPLGVDVVFAPDPADFTPAGRRTTVHVAGLTDRLEGVSRPGHFDGVTTIVAKLFNVVRPDTAYFSRKDYQQLLVMKAMVRDLDVPVRLVECDVVRDHGGLALSSRNANLSPAQRGQALALPAALSAAVASWDGDADTARARLVAALATAPGIELDYAEIADPDTLEPLYGQRSGPAQALIAARVGATRLIDNAHLRAVGPMAGT